MSSADNFRIGASDDEVEKMKQDAEKHAAEDAKRKSLIEARNNADSSIYTAEKALKDLGDKIGEDLKTKVNDGIQGVRSVIEGDDPETITKATEKLMESVQAMGAAAYQQSSPEMGGAEGEGETEASDDGEDVVEGEFTED